MRKFFKVLLVIIVIIIVAAGGMALYISQRSIPKYTVHKIDIKVESTPARVAQGQKLASMLVPQLSLQSKNKSIYG